MTEHATFRYWVARTLFVQAWADWEEQYGSRNLMGCELMNEAPESPEEAYDAADRLIPQFGDLETLLTRAAEVWRPNRGGGGTMVEELAYCLTMQALGHGVGWRDYQEPFDGWHPPVHFESSYFDLNEKDYPIPDQEENPNA